MTALIIILALLVIVGFAIAGAYNQLTKLWNNREQAFSDVDVQLNLRYDLVPNLVNVVKGYAKHEKTTLEEVTKMRAMVASAKGTDEKVQAENQFNSTLKTLFAVAENYPDLKANQNFIQLQDQLSDIENKIAAARRFFNNATKELNTAIMSFPNNVLNSFFHFKQGVFFDLGTDAEQTRKNVTVNMDE